MISSAAALRPEPGQDGFPHASFYIDNAEYAEFLRRQQPGFFAKYVQALQPMDEAGPILDVGCAVGQAVKQLVAAGYDAQGVDVCGPAIGLAQAERLPCAVYDGTTLPFEAGRFASVGAFNVLEHVEDPVLLIREMVRVTAPGRKIVVSSPNFLRVFGFRDYHPHMRGIGSKIRNARTLLAKRRLMRSDPRQVRFERLEPVVRSPIRPDDDAVAAVNPLELAFHLRREGCRVESVACTDRPIPAALDFLLNATPLRFVILNCFIVARKSDVPAGRT